MQICIPPGICNEPGAQASCCIIAGGAIVMLIAPQVIHCCYNNHVHITCRCTPCIAVIPQPEPILFVACIFGQLWSRRCIVLSQHVHAARVASCKALRSLTEQCMLPFEGFGFGTRPPGLVLLLHQVEQSTLELKSPTNMCASTRLLHPDSNQHQLGQLRGLI